MHDRLGLFCGTTLECYLWNTWLIGSVSIATATGLWLRVRGSLALKGSFWLHSLSPFCEPNYTDPLCAFSLTRYNTFIDGSHSYSGLKDRGQLKLCRMTIPCPCHARCLTGTVNVNISLAVATPWIELMIASYCSSPLKSQADVVDDAKNWYKLAALVRKSKADCMHQFQTEQVCLLFLQKIKKHHWWEKEGV